MRFICDNCGGKTKIGKSILALQCQKCGSFDLKFDCSVEVFPLIDGGGTLGKKVPMKKGESFYGNNPNGFGWMVKSCEELDSADSSVVSESLTKKDLPKRDFPEENDKGIKKSKLAKPVRKLKTGIDLVAQMDASEMEG